MIVAASSTPVYVPPSSRQDAVTRPDDTDAPDKKDDKRIDRSRPDFALMLALLANISPTARADAMKKMSPESASLVDRLLNGAGESTDAAALNAESLLSAEGPVNGALSHSDAMAVVQATMSAVDTMRYGMMQDGSLNGAPTLTEQTLRSASTGDKSDVFGRATGGEIADNIAIASAKRTLARIAGKRGVSQEQLLALGDSEGARAKAQIDTLLAYSGTAAGAALADRAAQAAALAAANAASASDVSTPVRDTNSLAPELRARVDRVISRMHDEYGSDVSVVETARSQERQDFLYAQGRTREGAVVTWTHDSAHTRGEAVDVLVDGKWNNAEGFARLQRIAREEGLRTLGIKDPGHLELARNGVQPDASATIANMIDRRTATVSNVGSQTGIASVAGVANVASVANVARSGLQSNAMVDANGIAADAVVTTIAANNAGSANDRGTSSRDQRDPQDRSADRDDASSSNVSDRATSQSRVDSSAAERAYMTSTTAPTTNMNGTHAASATSATTGISTAERVADVQQLKADAPTGSLSRMTLELDGVNGPERITVDVRGTVIDTQITTDAANADRLRMRTGELQDALGRHGLAADSVSISSNARTEATGTRPMMTEREGIVMTQLTVANNGADAQASGQSTRDRAMAREWERNEDARKARDEQRQNAERQNAERQHAGQRGQRGIPNEGAR